MGHVTRHERLCIAERQQVEWSWCGIYWRTHASADEWL